MTLENKSLKSANNQLHIGNNELANRMSYFEDLGFNLMSENQLRSMKDEYMEKLRLVCKETGCQTLGAGSVCHMESQTTDVESSKIPTKEFGIQVDQI